VIPRKTSPIGNIFGEKSNTQRPTPEMREKNHKVCLNTIRRAQLEDFSNGNRVKRRPHAML